MARLIAIDRPGGPEFVDELRSIWEVGNAAFPVDHRLPTAAKREVMAAMHVGDEVDEGDALVVTTSGSTGVPKGVVLTHRAVAASADASSRRLEVRADDHWLACLPLAHVGGLSVVTRSLYTGTRLTVHARFDADAVMASGSTLVSLVPTALARIDPSRFRTILLGGARPPADRPPNTIATYGMTETGSGIVYDGRPLDDVDVDIDADGEIRVRGPMLLRCYRDGVDPKDADGWFATGDLGQWRDDGRLHVDGRRDDLIITGGENVWPESVEQALRSHPSVADVLVRGVDDPEWGQAVEATVVPVDGGAPNLDGLRNHVKRDHPAHMAPKRLRLVDAIPRTALGKPIRRGSSATDPG